MSGSNLKTDITLHIFLLFSFLILFLQIIIMPMSSKAFDSTIRNTAKQNIDNLVKNMSAPQRQNFDAFGSYIFPFMKNVYNNADPIKTLNNNLMWAIVLIIIFFLFVIVIFFVFPSYKSNSDLLSVLSENVFVLLLVGIFEVLFFVYVLRSESHMSPEEITYYTASNFKKKYNKMVDNPEKYKRVTDTNNVILMTVIIVLISLVLLSPLLLVIKDKVSPKVYPYLPNISPKLKKW